VLVQAHPLRQHLLAPSVDGSVDTCGMGSTSPHTCSIDPCVRSSHSLFEIQRELCFGLDELEAGN